MTSPGVLRIRADADRTMGSGHIMRCLALAQNWLARGGRVQFFSRCQDQALRRRIHASGSHFIDLTYVGDPLDCLSDPSESQPPEDAAQREGSQNWLVFDGYHFSGRVYDEARRKQARVLCIDDFANLPSYNVAVIVNPNPHAASLPYHCPAQTRLLLGTQYVFLREEFLATRNGKREIADCARRVLVTLGGSVDMQALLKILRAVALFNVEGLEVKILGGFAENAASAIVYAASVAGTKVELVEPVVEMPKVMAWADLAIICGGGTLWELLFMGCPTLSFSRNSTQEIVLKMLEERRIVRHLGPLAHLSEPHVAEMAKQWIWSKQTRAEASGLGRDMIDGRGVERVMSCLLEGDLINA